MKYKKFISLLLVLALGLCGCGAQRTAAAQDTIVCTTGQLAEMTRRVIADTALEQEMEVSCVVTEPVSCLHDYTLSVRQMQLLERSAVTITVGLGLEDFMQQALRASNGAQIVASDGVEALPSDEEPGKSDPHIWLSPAACAQMARNIADGLAALYPADAARLRENAAAYAAEMDALLEYGNTALAGLSCRELVTFHDGFSYFAAAFGLTIAAAMEIEAGSEPSAKELEAVVDIVRADGIPAVFAEKSGTDDAAKLVARETGAAVYTLDMGLSGGEAIRHNIDTIKEALQ